MSEWLRTHLNTISFRLIFGCVLLCILTFVGVYIWMESNYDINEEGGRVDSLGY